MSALRHGLSWAFVIVLVLCAYRPLTASKHGEEVQPATLSHEQFGHEVSTNLLRTCDEPVMDLQRSRSQGCSQTAKNPGNRPYCALQEVLLMIAESS